ncbi:hypothetical protein MBLNU459_g7193t1 [Dothideomycetes sp. NU459]
MADEAAAPNRKTSKVKSKWGKLFKEDPDAANGKAKFKLNDDVVDFLKPSTEKERYSGAGTRQQGAPRLDTGAAQRWPEAEDVRRAADAGDAQPRTLPNGRPKRRKNLTVGFARTAPEIIGEGGDEADTPVVEVSRMKAKQLRSFSDRVPPALDTFAADQHRQPKNYPLSAPPTDPYAAKPALPRFQTSANETSYQLRQRPAESRTAEPQIVFQQFQSPIEHPGESMARPGTLARTPTGFNMNDAFSPTTTDEASPATLHSCHPLSGLLTERLGAETAQQKYDSPVQTHSDTGRVHETSPTDPKSPSAIIQNKMRAEEGQTLRRFSRGDFSDYAPQLSSSPPPDGSSPPRGPLPAIPDIHPTPYIHQDVSFKPFSPVHSQTQHPGHGPNQAQPDSSGSSYPGGSRDGRRAESPAAPRVEMSVPSARGTSGSQNQGATSYNEGGVQTHPAPIADYTRSSSPNAYRNGSLQAPHGTQSAQRPSGSPSLTQTPSRGNSPNYFSAHRAAPQESSSSSGLGPPQLVSRSCSQNSQIPIPASGDASEMAAFADFSSRVEHMRGVFRLTAERENPTSSMNPSQWLRAAIWWLHKGRAGLGDVVKHVVRDPDGQRRELLTQAHVDVAKTWWILSDVLDQMVSSHSPQQDYLQRDVEAVRSHLRSLTLSMGRNGVMPPHQSLIQGQDTTIWMAYPHFAPDVASVLRGSAQRPLAAGDDRSIFNALEALPLGDTRDSFCYSRMFVSVSVNTEDADTDRVVMPCILTMLRGRSDYQTRVVISSQVDLVNISIKPGDGGHGKGSTWHDVSWKNRSHGIYVRLPRGFTLNVDFQENDFRALWNMVEYTKKVEASLRPEPDEIFLHEARLVEVQYSDSSNPHAFPKDRVRACSALVFEKGITRNEGTGARRLHRGYRFMLVTNTINKTLSCVSFELGRGSPLLLEFVGNAVANEVPAMIVRVQEAKRQCKATLVFNGSNDRRELYEVLNSIRLMQDERLTGRATLKSLAIVPTDQSAISNNALESIQWQEVRVVNRNADQAGQEQGNTVLSENLRILVNHDSGCLSDRLNLGPGELLMRLPLSNAPTLQLLRGPQADMTVTIDTRHARPPVPEGLTELVQTVASKPTIRTFTFSSLPDLHAFQRALTRFTVRYDSPASLFAISRRRMVVPIYKKWEATKVRVQIVTLRNSVQVLAFFEDFSHADAMAFRIKTIDMFEKAKGDKGAKHCVRLVDAKFSLPGKEKDDEEAGEEDPSETKLWGKGVKRRFVNLEGLDYAEEHDDITIGFERGEDRDRFCDALPSATTAKSHLNFKRRI